MMIHRVDAWAIENHAQAVTRHFMHYNFCRMH